MLPIPPASPPVTKFNPSETKPAVPPLIKLTAVVNAGGIANPAAPARLANAPKTPAPTGLHPPPPPPPVPPGGVQFVLAVLALSSIGRSGSPGELGVPLVPSEIRVGSMVGAKPDSASAMPCTAPDANQPGAVSRLPLDPQGKAFCPIPCRQPD